MRSCACWKSNLEEQWGTDDLASLVVPSRRGDQAFTRWYAKYQRAGSRPRDASSYLRGVMSLDVRHALPAVRVPTLVLHAAGNSVVPIAQGRYIADQVIDLVEEFVTGVKRGPRSDRVLATVLFTDIVDSTQRAADLGDSRWGELLNLHNDATRNALAADGLPSCSGATRCGPTVDPCGGALREGFRCLSLED